MVVAHNLLAVNAQRQYHINGLNKKKSTEKLSSGYKINRAADDAAGLQISERMRRQINGLKRGTENMEDGVSWLQIGDGAMAEVHAILHRMDELAIQGANGTLSPSDRQAIDAEVQQLKTEINRINETTTFNEMRIFSKDDQAPPDDGSISIIDLEGVPADMDIFNATYDDASGRAAYGGIVFHGNRVSWDEIDPGMVYMDGGTQKFHAGTWMYMDDQNRMLTVFAEEGAEVPRIQRYFDIDANENGLLIDGKQIEWKDIRNSYGTSAAEADFFNEKWTADYNGAKLTFEVKNAYNGLEGMVRAIRAGRDDRSFRAYAIYNGSREVQAVDADIDIDGIRLSNDAAKLLAAGKGYVLRADTDGIWLQDGNGADIADSKRSWADMGITSWTQGADVQKTKTYRYSGTAGGQSAGISFDFTLSDITSPDSVIDGLDGVEISFERIKNAYETSASLDSAYPKVLDVALKQTTSLSVEDEVGLGRDFDDRTQTFDQVTDNGRPDYNPANRTVTMTYAKDTAGPVLTYVGNADRLQSGMNQDLVSYENSLVATEITRMLMGIPDHLDLGPKDLKNLLGASKITSGGTMSDQVTFTDAMDITTGRNVEIGETYPCGKIDFSGVGTDYDIWELVGSGFESTCGTCNQHYSFNFLLDVPGGKSEDGIRYSLSKGYPEAVLNISVSSLVESGVTTGEELAAALMKTVSGRFDYHFQQYAREGSVFYIHERKGQAHADFGTTAYTMEGRARDYSLTLDGGDNGMQTLTYTYDYSDFRDQVQVGMVGDAAGQYVKRAQGGYEPYDPALHAGAQRYSVQVSYSDPAGSGANSAVTGTRQIQATGTTVTVRTVGDAGQARDRYIEEAIPYMLGATTVTLQAKDYTRVDLAGNEKDNVALASMFRAYSIDPQQPMRPAYIKYEESVRIQKSGDVPNELIIPRFSLNSAVLGLGRANCLTEGACRNTIDMLNRALECVSARRSLYGALQNCLEHAISSNENTEENTAAAESRIRDTDMAREMVSYSRHSILEQAGISMMAQANQATQGVLALLK